jgi:hypothetical protein
MTQEPYPSEPVPGEKQEAPVAVVPSTGEVVSGPLALFSGTAAMRLSVADGTAKLLAPIIDRCNLSKKIGQRTYVYFEGWTTLGAMVGVFPVVSWSQPLEDGSGYEARVEARTFDGALVGAAEAMCQRTEKSWADRDDYALRSMAQTRAGAKAMRMPLGFIMQLGGYAATPAEEMDAMHDNGDSKSTPKRGARKASAKKADKPVNVEGRWRCRDCKEVNAADATDCKKCGRSRGSKEKRDEPAADPLDTFEGGKDGKTEDVTPEGELTTTDSRAAANVEAEDPLTDTGTTS